MINNIDIILNTNNTLILQEEDSVYFIYKGGFHDAAITKISECWYDPTLEDLDNKLKEALWNQGLTKEEINDEIAEFHDTEFYKKAKEYLREDELEETLDLPIAETLELELFDPFESDDELEELILDFLSNKYGYCINTFNYKINENETHVIITDIDWDTTE